MPEGAVVDVVVEDGGTVVLVVVVVVAAWQTDMVTVLPLYTCALAAGL